MNMYYSTMSLRKDDQVFSRAVVRFAREIGRTSGERISSIRRKSVYYSTASKAVLPLVRTYTIGLGQRGLAGILIWAARLGF
jgi:hypothetical protein